MVEPLIKVKDSNAKPNLRFSLRGGEQETAFLIGHKSGCNKYTNEEKVLYWHKSLRCTALTSCGADVLCSFVPNIVFRLFNR